MVAPNATPHAEEEIPASVLVTLDVLHSTAKQQTILPGAIPTPVPPPAPTNTPVVPTAAPAPAPAVPPSPPAEPVGSAASIPESKPKKPAISQEDLASAFSNITSGKSMTAIKPVLNEDGTPKPKPAPGEHLDAQDWQKTMLEARAKKRGLGVEDLEEEDEPPSRASRKRKITETASREKISPAMRRANKAAATL